MKPFISVPLVLMTVGLICAASVSRSTERDLAAGDGRNSGCVQCHTDVKKLIRLSWEVERIRGRPAVSTQIEGEG